MRPPTQLYPLFPSTHGCPRRWRFPFRPLHITLGLARSLTAWPISILLRSPLSHTMDWNVVVIVLTCATSFLLSSLPVKHWCVFLHCLIYPSMYSHPSIWISIIYGCYIVLPTYYVKHTHVHANVLYCPTKHPASPEVFTACNTPLLATSTM